MRADSVLKASRWDPAVVLASLGANLLSLVVPLSMIHLYDRIIPNNGYETLTVLGLVVVFAILLECVLRAARRLLLERGGENFELQSYYAAYSALIFSDPSHSNGITPGKLNSGLGAIERLRSLHSGEVAFAILDLPFACLFLIVIFMISPVVGLTVALILVTTLSLLRLQRVRLASIQNKRRLVEERRHSFLVECFSGIDAIKSMQIEQSMCRRYERLMAGSSEIGAKLVKATHIAQGMTATIGTFSPAIVACVGAFLAVEGQMTLGAVAAVILLTGRIIQPALRVEAFIAGLSTAKMERDDLENILSLPKLERGARALPNVERIEFSDVSISVHQGNSVHLKGINFSLKTGECLLVTGPEPQACSHLLKAVLGDVALDGSFEINGVAFSEFDHSALSQRVRYIGRDNALLAGTLLENLAAFDLEAYQDDAVELSRALGLDSFLAKTKEGYAVNVGQSSNSGLPKSIEDTAAIINGLVSCPDVLLFDHANATLDRTTDESLLEILRANIASRITILCSDRPSYQQLATHTLDITEFLTAAKEMTTNGRAS